MLSVDTDVRISRKLMVFHKLFLEDKMIFICVLSILERCEEKLERCWTISTRKS